MFHAPCNYDIIILFCLTENEEDNSRKLTPHRNDFLLLACVAQIKRSKFNYLVTVLQWTIRTKLKQMKPIEIQNMHVYVFVA